MVTLSFVNKMILALVFSFGKNVNDMVKPQFIYRYLTHNSDSDGEGQNRTLNFTITACGQNVSYSENYYQKQSSQFMMDLTLIEKGIALPLIIIFGIYSDFIGRRKAIVTSLTAASLKYGIMAVVILLDLDIKYLYLAMAVSGLGGSENTFFAALTASLADETPRNSKRSIYIALYYASVGAGMSIALFTTGYMIHDFGFFVPAAVGSGVMAMTPLIALFAIPDSRPNAKTEGNFQYKNILKEFTSLYRNTTSLHGHPVWIFCFMLLSFCLMYSCNNSRQDIDYLFEMRSPFCWTSEYLSWYNTAQASVRVIGGSILAAILQKCMSDEIIVVLGTVSAVGYALWFAFAKEDWMLIVGAAFGVLSIVPIPCYKASMSKMVVAERQGALFASVYIADVVCTLAGSAIFNNIYSHTQSSMHGSVYIVMGGVNVVSIIIFSFTLYHKRKYRTDQTECLIQDVPSKEASTSITNCDTRD